MQKIKNEHTLHILEANYWEHYKFAKDISMFYPHDHPKRIHVETETNKLLKELNEFKEKMPS